MSLPIFSFVSKLSCSVLGLMLVMAQAGTFAQKPFEPWKVSQDPVAKLWGNIALGKVKLDMSSEKALLVSVLKELDVSQESQVLVFSKTSLQNALIGPATPRAIFYNEDCYVGSVQGGALELIGMDPEKGPQFYVVSYPFSQAKPPRLVEGHECLSCHRGVASGLQILSVYANEEGQPLPREGSFVTSPESPLSERWGGWYVTGKHGSELHMGNVTTKETATGVFLDRKRGANVTSLESFISTEPYLTKTSDIVALMVLEHQYVMHNTLTSASEAVRKVMARETSDQPSSLLKRSLRTNAIKVVHQLLFSGEYELQDGGVEGNAAFQETFRRNRKVAAQGDSLKDFQLKTQLFKNRCSYMIYSATFDGLPALLKREIYTILDDVLNGQDDAPEYAHLSVEERANVARILRETKPEIVDVWRK